MKGKRPGMKGQFGFSMVEVLVAMAIVPFGLLGVGKLQSHIMSSGAETKTRAEALYVAEQKLEELRAFAIGAYDPLQPTLSNYSDIDSGSDSITLQAGSNANLTRTWTVTDNISPAYKTIVLNVAWTGSDNVAKSVVITSFVSLAEPIVSGQKLLP